MSRWRVILIFSLFTIPVVIFLGAATYVLWQSGNAAWLLWLFPPCWMLAWVLLRFRPRGGSGRGKKARPLPMHWTPRDQAAFEIVREAKQAVAEIPVGELSNPHFYLQSALDLSVKVAQHYHPKSSDPISSLTVVEVLAAAQLAVEDTSAWLHQNVPGSHLLTIRHWRTLSRAPQWMQVASDVSWLLTLLWNPLNLPRWLATRFASTSATQEIEASLLAALFREFLHNVGLYCIEMNSGRLRGGVARNRAAMERLRHKLQAGSLPNIPASPSPGEDEAAVDGAVRSARDATHESSASSSSVVRIAIVGQVNAGKSSLINALIGENRARCDVIATTDRIERYRFTAPATREQFELLDTPGYGSMELTDIQRGAIREAWTEADLVLLVMDVTSPARAADWRTFDEVNSWYSSQPQLKPPRVFGVLTHIDGLAPAFEWQPPYDWNRPVRPKEKNMRAAVEYTEHVFSDELDGVIPVCTDAARGRVYGIQEWLFPALIASLPEAKASLVVRMLHQEANAERLAQLVRQFRGAGTQLLRSLLKIKK